MCELTRPLEASESIPEILRVLASLIEKQLTPLPMVELAALRIETREDLERWIDEIHALWKTSRMMSTDQEERLNVLLSCLLVASLRASMFARENAARPQAVLA